MMTALDVYPAWGGPLLSTPSSDSYSGSQLTHFAL